MIDAAQTAPTSLEARLAAYRPQVRRHILAMVRDAALADELTQDTYARALERIDQLRDPQAGLAWLYRIATTLTLDRLRKRRPATIPLDSENLSPEIVLAAARQGPPSLIETALERSDMSDCVQSYLETTASATRRSLVSSAARSLRRRSDSTEHETGSARRSLQLAPSRSTSAACLFATRSRGPPRLVQRLRYGARRSAATRWTHEHRVAPEPDVCRRSDCGRRVARFAITDRSDLRPRRRVVRAYGSDAPQDLWGA